MKSKRNYTTVLLVIILVAGMVLLLYPSVSDYWNSFHQSRAIASYAENVANMDNELYEKMWEEAAAYNGQIPERKNVYVLEDEEKEKYHSLLDVSGTGIMGYVEIPVINCALPIYHGTEESVLQIAVGHLEWSSLPVGGEGSHSVVSAHRGLPSAKLFTDLDQLAVGDTFMLRVLDEVLTYEVDQILIVEPQETEALKIEEEKDYCTLVTCTPYGINSHRLFVRGHRVENAEGARVVKVTADAYQVEPMLVVPFIGVPLAILAFIVMLAPKKRAKRNMEKP